MVKLSLIRSSQKIQSALVAWLLLALGAQAAPLRVVTWSLRPSHVAGTNGQLAKFQSDLVAEAADALKKINPDVILLQAVNDWNGCQQLAKAMKPAVYNVALCSSFGHVGGGQEGRQVAILSKYKAYISWAEAWTAEQAPAAPGGFAFAAIRVGDKNVGLFSVQLDDVFAASAKNEHTILHRSMREESARQLVQQIASLENWQTNQLQAFVVGGDFNTSMKSSGTMEENTLAELQQIGFENTLGTLPGNGTDHVFALGAKTVDAHLVTGALMERGAMVCELDLQVPPFAVITPKSFVRAEVPSIKTIITIPQTKEANPALPIASAKPDAIASNKSLVLWSLGIGIVIILFLSHVLNRHSPPKPDGSEPVSVSMVQKQPDLPVMVTRDVFGASQSARDSFAANLSRWLKEKFVRKLISDRAQLMATQQVAALKVKDVDERLARIEKQIHERNQEYEQRIDELMAELADARDENRELIQAKIDLVKAQMAKQHLKADRFFPPNHQN